MTPETASKIEAAIDRFVSELGIGSYEDLLRSTPTVILHALFCQMGFNKAFPGTENLDGFSDYLGNVHTKDSLHRLLLGLNEPGPDQLKLIFSGLKILPSLLKRGLAGYAGQIRPRGGPPEKLSSPDQIRKLVDEICDACKNGDTLEAAQRRVAHREDVSLKTVQRRYREEMKRRRSLHSSLSPPLSDDGALK